MNRRWKWAMFLVVLLVGMGYGCLALDRYLDPFDDLPFNQAAWAQATNEEERGPMARDAIRYLPAGLRCDEVRRLLGEPQEIVPLGRRDRWGMTSLDAETWNYYLGSWSALHWYGWDSASLYVHFDNKGCIVKSEITGG